MILHEPLLEVAPTSPATFFTSCDREFLTYDLDLRTDPDSVTTNQLRSD